MKTNEIKFKDGYQVGMKEINGSPLPKAGEERVLSKKEQAQLGILTADTILSKLRSQPKRGTLMRVDAPKVLPTRKSLGISQKDFASLVGVTVASVRNWEQGRGTPPAMARKLFRVIEKRPDIVKYLSEV